MAEPYTPPPPPRGWPTPAAVDFNASFETPVHVDTAPRLTPAQQTGGQRYDDTLQRIVTARPALCCPRCARPVYGLSSAGTYTVRRSKPGAKSTEHDLPLCPVSREGWPDLTRYTLAPCGCVVHATWAMGYAEEKNNRLNGRPPQGFALEPAVLDGYCRALEKGLTALYQRQTRCDPEDLELKRAIDYWIMVIADQMIQLFPNTTVQAMPVPLDTEVTTWATERRMLVPNLALPAHNQAAQQTRTNVSVAATEFSYPPNYPMPRGMGTARVEPVPTTARELVQTRTNDMMERLLTQYGFPGHLLQSEDMAGYSSSAANLRTFEQRIGRQPQAKGGTVARKEEASTRDALLLEHFGAGATEPWLHSVLDYFRSHTEFIMAFVASDVLANPGLPRQQLSDVVSSIRNNLESFLARRAEMHALTINFLRLFKTIINPHSVAAPKPAAPEYPRGRRKRRTIRRIEE